MPSRSLGADTHGLGEVKSMHRYLIALIALLFTSFTRSSLSQLANARNDNSAIHRANIRTDDRTILMGVDADRRGGIKPIDTL
jgi:hypothetical protein